MSTKPKRHHYVPKWYQKGFMPEKSREYYFLELDETYSDLSKRKVLRGPCHSSPNNLFCENGLYSAGYGVSARTPRTLSLINQINASKNEKRKKIVKRYIEDPGTVIERILLGKIDLEGKRVVHWLTENRLEKKIKASSLRILCNYLSAQALRTPKGLKWIERKYPIIYQDPLKIICSSLKKQSQLVEMMLLIGMHKTIWMESVREIVSAVDSDVKFIVSDHPVTIYNPSCPPSSDDCQYPNDPSILLNGTHTLFALNRDYCIVFTHYDYAICPSKVKLTRKRKNSRYHDDFIPLSPEIRRTRKLSKYEVIKINYLLKSRANLIAAHEKEWLFPEEALLQDETEASIWNDIKKILLPRTNELISINAISIDDKKNDIQQYLENFGIKCPNSYKKVKKREPHDIDDHDKCGCGSRYNYADCCKHLDYNDRLPWDVLDLCERNNRFIVAASNICEFSPERKINSAYCRFTGEKISKIHEKAKELWSVDTDLADLLPRPRSDVFRAVYCGQITPETADLILRLCPLFDEIIVLCFYNNPVSFDSNNNIIEQYRKELFNNIWFAKEIMPLMNKGIVSLVPNPLCFNHFIEKTIFRNKAEETTIKDLFNIDVKLAVYIAQLTGACFITNDRKHWSQLHCSPAALLPIKKETKWSKFIKKIQNFDTEYTQKLLDDLLRLEGGNDDIPLKEFFRNIWNSALLCRNAPLNNVIIGSNSTTDASNIHQNTKPNDFKFELPNFELSIPHYGFDTYEVNCLLVASTRRKYLASLPMALFAKPD